MFEFNPDGSIKLPGKMLEQEAQNQHRLKTSRCIEIKKDVVSHTAPKRCELNITFSEQMTDFNFVKVIVDQFKERVQTPIELLDSNTISIGTDFRRCSNCTALIGRLREHMNGNLILKNGNCTAQTHKSMSYEDYFD